MQGKRKVMRGFAQRLKGKQVTASCSVGAAGEGAYGVWCLSCGGALGMLDADTASMKRVHATHGRRARARHARALCKHALQA